jgi:hypothetical protein
MPPPALPTPGNAQEAAGLVQRLQHAIHELQLGEAERMTYELIRFHWQRDGRRLDHGHAILEALATRNLGNALHRCDELLDFYVDEAAEPLVRISAVS